MIHDQYIKTLWSIVLELKSYPNLTLNQLSERLQMTPNQLQQQLNNLQTLGLPIALQSNKIIQTLPLDLLDTTAIKAALPSPICERLDCIKIELSTPSTNTMLLEAIKQHPIDKPAVLLAEHMSAGRGRLNRNWAAPLANNIYLSLFWPFTHRPPQWTALGLVMAVSVFNTLRGIGLTDGLALKWPNDVLYQQRKISGILIESLELPNISCAAIIGIGINTHIPVAFRAQINQPIVDLTECLATPPSRNTLAAELLTHCFQDLDLFQQEGLAPFLPTWQQHHLNPNIPLSIHTPTQIICGKMVGISEDGRLIVRDDSGLTHLLHSGDVSIQK